jgi:hypothetical protein
MEQLNHNLLFRWSWDATTIRGVEGTFTLSPSRNHTHPSSMTRRRGFLRDLPS